MDENGNISMHNYLIEYITVAVLSFPHRMLLGKP
jgi:hypothetical protein